MREARRPRQPLLPLDRSAPSLLFPRLCSASLRAERDFNKADPTTKSLIDGAISDIVAWNFDRKGIDDDQNSRNQFDNRWQLQQW